MVEAENIYYDYFNLKYKINNDWVTRQNDNVPSISQYNVIENIGVCPLNHIDKYYYS